MMAMEKTKTTMWVTVLLMAVIITGSNNTVWAGAPF